MPASARNAARSSVGCRRASSSASEQTFGGGEHGRRRRCPSGSGNRRARTRAVRRAGRAARRRQSRCVGMVRRTPRRRSLRAASDRTGRRSARRTSTATCKRAAVAADEKRGAVHQARAVPPATALSHRRCDAARATGARSRRRQHARRRLAVGRPARRASDPAIRARRDQRRRQRGERRLGPAPKRIAGAHVQTTTRASAGTPQRRQPPIDRRARRRIDRHLDAIASPDPRAGQTPDRPRRADPTGSRPSAAARSSARPVDDVRVHPRPARHIVAHSHGRAARPGEPRAARPAVQSRWRRRIALARSRRASRTSSRTRRQPRTCGDGDDVGQMRIVGHDGAARRFDQIRRAERPDSGAAARESPAS